MALLSFVIGTKGYVFGGFDNYNCLADLWEYDSESGSWTEKASPIATDPDFIPRCSSAAFALDGKGYIGLGADGEKNLDDFWMYDPAADSWTQKASFTEGGQTRRSNSFRA